MEQFNFYPFITMEGQEPESYKVKQWGSGCRNTIQVIAKYQNSKSWMYTFYVWKLPTCPCNTYEFMMSSFKRQEAPTG